MIFAREIGHFLIFGVLLVDENSFELRKTNVTAFVTADITPFSLLNKIEQEVFDLIENNPKITRKEIAIKINKTIRTVQRITDKLVDKKDANKSWQQSIWILGSY